MVVSESPRRSPEEFWGPQEGLGVPASTPTCPRCPLVSPAAGGGFGGGPRFAAIEDEYSGPKLEDGKVTLAFMKDLMQWYKEQKKLHRKCAYQVPHFSQTPPQAPRWGQPRPRSATCPPLCVPPVPAARLPQQILVQVKEVLAKLPTLVETTLKEVGAPLAGCWDHLVGMGGPCGGSPPQKKKTLGGDV